MIAFYDIVIYLFLRYAVCVLQYSNMLYRNSLCLFFFLFACHSCLLFYDRNLPIICNITTAPTKDKLAINTVVGPICNPGESSVKCCKILFPPPACRPPWSPPPPALAAARLWVAYSIYIWVGLLQRRKSMCEWVWWICIMFSSKKLGMGMDDNFHKDQMKYKNYQEKHR